jgi:Fe-S-cluster containining protein
VALKGEVGVKVSCAIYEYRPNVCRSFQPNTPDCAKVRRYFHLEEHP